MKVSKYTEYDTFATSWNREVGNAGAWHQKYDIDPLLFKLLGNIKEKTILEIGCGNGYFARILARKGAKVSAFDISPKLIKFAKQNEKENTLVNITGQYKHI